MIIGNPCLLIQCDNFALKYLVTVKTKSILFNRLHILVYKLLLQNFIFTFIMKCALLNN